MQSQTDTQCALEFRRTNEPVAERTLPVIQSFSKRPEKCRARKILPSAESSGVRRKFRSVRVAGAVVEQLAAS